MNENLQAVEHGTTKKPSMRLRPPLAYEEACQRFVDWSEQVAAAEGLVLFSIPTPNQRLSHVVGNTWHLLNVNGPLVKVGWNGRVWPIRTEDN